MSDQLYELLTEEKTAEIPWPKAAEYFVTLKLASGGLLPEEIDEIKTAALISREGRMKEAGLERPNQPRAKELVPGRGPEARAARAAVRDKLREGCPVGKAIDAELKKEKTAQDYPSHQEHIRALLQARAREQLRQEVREAKKKGILSGLRGSVAQDITHASRIRRQRGERVGKTLGSIGGALGGILAARKGKMPASAQIGAAALASALGYGGGKTIGSEIDRRRVKARYRPKKAEIEKTSSIKDRLSAVSEKMDTEFAQRQRQKLKRTEGGRFLLRLNEMMGGAKTAAVNPPMDGEATEIPVQEGVGTSPLDDFLQAQQDANELEFFRQQAEEAQAAAADAEERAGMAEQQVQQVDQERQVEQQNMAAQQDQAQQQVMMAQQQSQVAQQDAVQARDESLAAQQANIALRQTITAYRQALMNLIAQDPTQQVPPAPVPQGPMPGMQPGGEMPGATPAEGAPTEGVPAEGAPAPAGGAPAAPPEQAAAPGPPPAAPGPGGMGGPPAAPPTMKPPGGAQGGPPKPPTPAGPPAA